MIDYILLLADLLRALTRTHGDLVAENLLLRHRPTQPLDGRAERLNTQVCA
jgi:hypothetical protein